MKIFELIKSVVDKIKSDTAQLDAELLLAHVLEKDRMYLYLNRDIEVSSEQKERFLLLAERRAGGEPLQYITGVQEFMSLDFFVKPGVLIPRNDTEVLVEEVLKLIKDIKEPIIADVGCGSGAISISLAKYMEDAKVYALDIMDIPLEVTAFNAGKHDCLERVAVERSDKLSYIRENQIKLDAVISNPPYIRDEVIDTLMTEVKDHEPITALSGGRDGLVFYRDITREAKDVLKPGGLLAYEIGHDQREELLEILKENGFEDIEALKDLSGNDRVVLGWMPK